MTWARLDDLFPEHASVWPLSDAAFRLHVSGICHATKLLTDGVVRDDRVAGLVPRFKRSSLTELIEGGRWHVDGHDCDECAQPGADAYVIHGFLERNPAAEKVKAERAAAAERMRARRAARSPERSPERVAERSVGRSPSPTRPDPEVTSRGGDTSLLTATDARPPSLHHELLTPAKRTPEHLDELDAIVSALVERNGADAVTDATRKLLDQRHPYAWPSDVRKALLANLGEPAPVDPTPTCDDCGGRFAFGSGWLHARGCPRLAAG